MMKTAGILVFLFAMLSNIEYAFFGYSIGEGNGNYALAQTTSSSNPGGNNDGMFCSMRCANDKECPEWSSGIIVNSRYVCCGGFNFWEGQMCGEPTS